MRVRIELNENGKRLWEEVEGRPEFDMTTKSGIVYALLLSYLKHAPPPDKLTQRKTPQPPALDNFDEE